MQPYELLEKEWAEFNNLNPSGMVACSSGTAALHLAFEGVGLDSKSSTVVMADFNMIACPRAAKMAGYDRAFADCDDTLNMNANTYDNTRYTGKKHILLATHIYGRPVDKKVFDYSRANVTETVIEDLSEVHGKFIENTTYTACWSFYKNKIVAGEEGGCVWFYNTAAAEHARKLRSLGFTEKHDYTHIPRGCNYRLANCLADLIRKSIKDYRRNVEIRHDMVDLLDAACPSQWKMPRRRYPWVYDIRIPNLNPIALAEIVASDYRLRYSFKPMTMQPEFCIDSVKGGPATVGVNALKASQEVFYLSLNPGEYGYYRSNAKAIFDSIQKIVENVA